ncbi:MAG: isoprenylcysteine carboxylmethyltransferase family protein [Bacteroidetes bacterium]|nr:isoprenylcysteine carboxylmethyltransferase family protein [Bacteroidota bacterium]
MRSGPPIWKHVRDVLILPVTVTCVIPWLIHAGSPAWMPTGTVVSWLAVVLFCSGLLLFATTLAAFVKRGNGTLAPWTPTQRLIVSGPYRYCRNPMITGVLLILCAEALWLRSGWIAVEAVIFFAVNTVYFILAEEPSMEHRFGQDYRAYKADVPRWIPRLKPYFASPDIP